MPQKIEPKIIAYITSLSLFLIFASQAYLVYEYFVTTRNGLSRESNNILNDAFRTDLSRRNDIFEKINGTDQTIIAPPITDKSTAVIDLSQTESKDDNVLSIIDKAINTHISTIAPLDINKLDSITKTILKNKKINTDFIIKVIDQKSGKTITESPKTFNWSVFLISSDYITIDLYKKNVLQLVLVNPFKEIVERMGLMLGSSLIFSLICFWAFSYLQRILARQKELVAFKNDFLSSIAHELKRPVASLSFNLDCLTMPEVQSNAERNNQLLKRSISATDEMNATINMLVALAREEEGMLKLKRTETDLVQMLTSLKDRFGGSSFKKVTLDIQCELTQLKFNCDEELLNHCVANLIDNAIKYSGKEVKIDLGLKQTDTHTIISVKDNGNGIAEDKLTDIFGKYKRANTATDKTGGFGIGLNYVKTIVEKHGGRVEVESTPGVGSEFRIVL